MGVWVVFVNRQPQYFADGVGYQVEDESTRGVSTPDDVDTIHVVDAEGTPIASFPAASVWEVEIHDDPAPGT
jgi:hypothetical protein